ncbi:MAG: hypothetical protein CMJ78_23725 [Planctomycetaceae bacterium]|nr:hypothetical protein [Planctomycetaceae bacterium]
MSETCVANVYANTDATKLDFGEADIHRWSDLVKVVQRSQLLGLRLTDPRSSCFVHIAGGVAGLMN